MRLLMLVMCATLSMGHYRELQANTDFSVSSVYHGGQPWMYVTEDNGGSARKPGIYVSSASGSWELILEGKVLVKRINGAILSQLPISNVDNRYEAVAVVNGAVCFFNANSKNDHPKSILKLGYGDGEVLDLVNQMPVKIPLVNDSEEISIFGFEGGGKVKSQLVLVSIKHDSLNGSGITIALNIKKQLTEESSMELMQPPVVLDYSFRTNQELQDLVAYSNVVYSKNLLLWHSQPKPWDNVVISEWRKQLLDAANGSTSLISQNDSVLPYYDPEENKVMFPHVPEKTIDMDGTTFTQIYDPLTGRDGILAKTYDQNPLTHFSNIQYDIHGRFDLDSLNSFIRYSDLNYGYGTITVINGCYYLFLKTQDGVKWIALTAKTKRPQNFGFHINQFRESLLVLISEEFADGQKVTTYYNISIDKQGNLRKELAYKIAPEFYTSEELVYRLHKSEDGHKLLFDKVTPLVASKKEYRGIYRDTQPHIDLFESNQSEIVQFYPKALLSERIASRITYQEFEQSASKIQRTGFYFTEEKEGKAHSVFSIPSKAIPFTPVQTDSLVSAALDIKIPKIGECEVRAVVTASDNKGDGSDGFDIIIFFSPKNKAISPTFQIINVPHPVKGLKTLQFAVQDGKIHPYLALFYTIDVEPEKSMSRTGKYIEIFRTMAVELDLQFQSDGTKESLNIKSSRVNGLSAKLLSTREITSRIRFDNEGELYWVETPEFKSEDVSFRLRRLINAAKVEPAISANIDGKSRKFFEIDSNGKSQTTEARGSWKVWSDYDVPELRALREKDLGGFSEDTFSNLVQLLESIADPSKDAEHVVLLVPDELLQYVREFIHLTRLNNLSKSKFWSKMNQNLKLYFLNTQKSKQYDIFENLIAMVKAESPDRPILYANLEDIKTIGRPDVDASDSAFLVNDVVTKKESTKVDDVPVALESIKPHILYLLANEGSRTDLSDFENRELKPRVPMLLVGKKESWKELIENASPEERYGLSKKFKVIEMPIPTSDQQKELVLRALRKPEIQGLRYRFEVRGSDANGSKLNQAEAEEEIAGYIVARVGDLCQKPKRNVFTALMKYLNLLTITLSTDRSIREDRVINEGVIERVFSEVFSVPLDLGSLKADDPLKILSQKNAPLLIQENGFDGKFSYTTKILDTILSQTRGDKTRPIPSSVVILGKSGTGKTSLFKALVSATKQKLYNFKNPNDPEVSAIILDVGRIVPDMKAAGATGKDDLMTVEEAIEHLDNFLSLPRGYRGFILIDDISAGSDMVRGRILARLRSLFDNEIYSARNKATQKHVERPVRNLNLFMFLNPTSDWSKIYKHMSDASKHANKPTPAEITVASLAGEGLNFEMSHILRWALQMMLDEVFSEVRTSRLSSNTLDVTKDIFSNSRKMVIVSPQAIKSVADKFKEEDARTYLSVAGRELTSKADRITDSSITLVVPGGLKSSRSTAAVNPWELRVYNHLRNNNEDVTSIEDFIRKEVDVVSVDKSVEGQARFIQLIINSYRSIIYERLIKSIDSDSRFALTPEDQRTVLAPTYRAIWRHLKENESITLKDIKIDSVEMGITNEQDKNVLEELIAEEKREQPLFPFKLDSARGIPGLFNELVDHTKRAFRDRTRRHELADTTDDIRVALFDYLGLILNVNSLNNLPQSDAWLRGLKEEDEPNNDKKIGKSLTDILWELPIKLQKGTLFEVARPDKFSPIYDYDNARLFLLSLDRAILKMPWIQISKFLIDSILKATNTMSLGRLVGVQNFLFKSKSSIVIPRFHEVSLQMTANSPAFDEWNDKLEKQMHERFTADCTKMLLLGGGK